jgi:sugar phosphate isomerase/epimerase
MCDREGDVGDPDEKNRAEAVENHLRWIEAAEFLGCHSIRVNARSNGSPEEQHKLVVDGLTRLGEAAKPMPQRGIAYQPGATLRVSHGKHECVLKERRRPVRCHSAFHGMWRPYRTRKYVGV